MQKYYRGLNGAVFAYPSDGSQDHRILPGLVQLSDQEVQQHLQAGQSTAVAQVPAEVSTFQAKAAMLEAGMLDGVIAYIGAPGTDPLVKLAWDTVQVFRRNSLMVMAVAIQLNLSDQQIDALFTRAAQIVV